MSLQEIADAVALFVRQHPGWALPIVFFLAFGESLCIVSLVLPATFILAGIVSVLAAGGAQFSELWPAILVAGVGGTLGYATSYWIGLYFKDSIRDVWPFRTHPRLIPRGERFFAKYGFAGVFLGHFFGPIRGVIPLAAGMFGMRQSSFQMANVISAFIWAVGVMAPFFFLVGAKDNVAEFLRAHEYVVALALFAIAFLNAVPNLLLAVPSLLLFLALAAAHILAGGNALPLLIAGAAGAFAGDFVFYRKGATGNADFSTQRLIDADPEDISDVRAYLARHGAAGIVASKFLGMKRCLVPVISGLDGMPLGRFLPVSALSSVIWAVGLLLPIYVLPDLLQWLSATTGIGAEVYAVPPAPVPAPTAP
jgi:membrane protein DedA with SNARE-associated domain